MAVLYDRHFYYFCNTINFKGEDMEIKPDKKLFTKQWYVLLTISIFVLLAAVIIQTTVPLSPSVTSAEVSVILWPITIGAILLLWLICVPIIILWIKNLTYFIEEERITIHKGILTKVKQNVPCRAKRYKKCIGKNKLIFRN